MRKTVVLKRIPTLLFIAVFAITAVCGITAMTVRADEDSATVAVEAWDPYADTWALTDALGRTAADYSTAGGVAGNKQVGIFYSVWHDSIMENTCRNDAGAPRNITQIIENNDDWLTNGSLFGPAASYHYWGEPLYGYYDLAEDDWVVRQHAILLSEAGVDYIMCDLTNFYGSGSYNATETCKATLLNICKVFREMRAEGQKTPGVTLLLTWNPSYCAMAVEWMYENVIKDNLDVWYEYEGKPLLFGSDANMPESLKSIFTFRSVAANYDASNSWQWLSNYPQSYVKGSDGIPTVMTVSVAQNWTDGLAQFTYVNEYGQFIGQGRSFTSESHRLLTNPTDPAYHSEYGYNFQEQFNRALDMDPNMIIVSGWNEWIAARFFNPLYPDATGQGLPNNANFVDAYTTEFSRDIEMTREGKLADNFYNQLVENIRLYKGVRKAPDYKQIKTISSMADWESVAAYYRDDKNDAANRDADSVSPKYHYTNMTGRNDIVQAKVSRDDTSVYFYVECAEDIVGMADGKWMRLYVKTTGQGGWEGYNYVINKDIPSEGVTAVYRFDGSWENTEKVGDAQVTAEGKSLYIKVALADLGLSADDVSFEFKWHDNPTDEGDVLDFYLSGDCAPNARFNYVYTEKTSSVNLPRSASLYAPEEGYEAMILTDEETVAQRFTVKADFVGVDVFAYNLTNDRASYTVSLYKFNSDYAATIAAQPLITQKYTNAYDETALFVGARLIGAGEYLLVVSDIKSTADNSVGVYYCEDVENGGLYLNGQYGRTMGLRTRIYYADSAALKGTVSGGTEGSGKTTTVMLDTATLVTGISVKPVIENGAAKNFPKNLKIYVSADGETYKLARLLDYADYTATPADQVFAVDGAYKSVKVVYDGEIAGVEVLSPLAVESAPITEKPADRGCGSTLDGGIAGGGLLVILAAALVAIRRKKERV